MVQFMTCMESWYLYYGLFVTCMLPYTLMFYGAFCDFKKTFLYFHAFLWKSTPVWMYKSKCISYMILNKSDKANFTCGRVCLRPSQVILHSQVLQCNSKATRFSGPCRINASSVVEHSNYWCCR